jgi:hypothetical protein
MVVGGWLREGRRDGIWIGTEGSTKALLQEGGYVDHNFGFPHVFLTAGGPLCFADPDPVHCFTPFTDPGSGTFFDEIIVHFSIVSLF